MPATIGRAGVRHDKREGDGATPAGAFRVVRVWYRGDRHGRPRTALPVRRIRPDSGWCDDPNAGPYNRSVRLPVSFSHEEMWRADGLYDWVIELDHNTRPRQRGRGSAIFVHVARADGTPTAGCIALAPRILRRFLDRVGPNTRIKIH